MAGYTVKLMAVLMLSEVGLVQCFQSLRVLRPESLRDHARSGELLQFVGHGVVSLSMSPTSGRNTDEFLRSPAQKQEEEEEALSDVDARVLREMLQESKLDLQTADDLRKLLDRGTKKKAPKPEPTKEPTKDSIFESKVLQTFTDTNLWKAFAAKTNDLLESAKIWVSNKIEQDVKTLAALGIFAWDRAVRDVGRALPEAGTYPQKVQLLLSNSSSFQEQIFLLSNASSFQYGKAPTTADSLRQELNRPADEIKSVSRAIWDILNGKTDSVADGGGRGLRTVAKAGTANMGDRQRRAFRQQRMKREQETTLKSIQKLPGGLADITYELRQELTAETNPAGYKTKPIRQAIEAGVIGTGKYLEGIQESARLAAAERKAKLLQAAAVKSVAAADAATTGASATASVDSWLKNSVPDSVIDAIETTVVETIPEPAAVPMQAIPASAAQVAPIPMMNAAELLYDLQVERDSMLTRLITCIQKPEETWLQSDFLTSEARTLSEDSLREVATLMILLRDELNSTSATATMEETVDSCLEQLRMDLQYIDQLRASVAGTISMPIGNTLYDIIVGRYDAFESEEPLLLRLDEVEKAYRMPPPPSVVEEQPKPYSFFADLVSQSPQTIQSNQPTQTPEVAQAEMETKTNNSNEGNRNFDSETTSFVDASIYDYDDGTEEWYDDTVQYVEVGKNEEIPVVVSQGGRIKNAAVMDIVPESVFRGQSGISASIGDDAVVVDSVTGAVFMAEIVTDDDFDTAVGAQKAVAAVDEESTTAEPNFVLTGVLRSLDVIFFVLEKLFIVAVPKAILMASTAAKRWDEVNQGGKGKKGWETIRNTADPKGRY